ncbi:MAG: hypothetical protein HYY28_02725 [Betaproteobacteria bacterium]|nr:hypothetical protein [Betaproteobacteria bacterium]MBI2959202.1 hypothetical protein [Betaproteobacteria bacterium]
MEATPPCAPPSNSRRLSILPEVKTVAEQGYPGFETVQWYGLNAPAKTPNAIVERLAAEAARAAKSPMVVKQLETDAAEPIGSTPQEYADYIASEQARWREVVHKARIKAD